MFRNIGLVALIAVIAVGVVALRKANASLRERVAGLERMNQQMNALRGENLRLRESLDRLQQQAADAQQVIKEELRNAKAELAAAEESARERRVQIAARVVAQAENTDPNQGITRLEHFKNVGRATPAATLQTVVWGMMQHEDGLLASMLSITGPAREKAEALLNGLPPAQRVKFPTSEALAVVAVTEQILKAEAFAITGFTPQDANFGTLTLRRAEPGRPENTKDGKVGMILGPGGWQIVVPEQAIDGILRRISEGAGVASEK